MTTPYERRLLPWPGPDGKPCYLSTENDASYMSRLADNIESTQLGLATDLLDQAKDMLADTSTEPDELRLLAEALAEALRDTLRVAASRGQRLTTMNHNRP